MTEEKKSHGGARPGAGRKPDREKKYATEVRLTAEERDILRALGGSSWLRKVLRDYIDLARKKDESNP